MSVRLTGQDVTIVVPGAEIVCDVCKKAWPYDPNIIHFQAADAWRVSVDHYAVSLRHCVGARMPVEILPEKHVCHDCLPAIFQETPK